MTFINNCAGYKIDFDPHAKRDLKKLDRKTAKKIIEKLDDLVAGEENLDIKKLENRSETTYRLRYGDFRIFYQVDHGTITVLVIKINQRKDAYRG